MVRVSSRVCAQFVISHLTILVALDQSLNSPADGVYDGIFRRVKKVVKIGSQSAWPGKGVG